MNEEGEIIEHSNHEQLNAEEADMMGGNVEIGFEEENYDANLPLDQSIQQTQNRLRDMFNVHQSKRFEAAGGNN